MNYTELPENFYRVSVKALITNDEGKILITQEEKGTWDLPGGGLDFSENPQEGLAREIQEEMGIVTTHVSETPCGFFRSKNAKGFWQALVVYNAQLQHLDFTPSEECVDIRFVSYDEAQELPLYDWVYEVFDAQAR